MPLAVRFNAPFSFGSLKRFQSNLIDGLLPMLSAIHGIEFSLSRAFHSARDFFLMLFLQPIGSRMILAELGFTYSFTSLWCMPCSSVSTLIDNWKIGFIVGDHIVPHSLYGRELDDHLPWLGYSL